MRCFIFVARKQPVLPDSLWKEDNIRKPEHGILQTLPVSFSIAVSVAYLLAIIKLSCEYKCQ